LTEKESGENIKEIAESFGYEETIKEALVS
jgi:hypothetical protein